MAAEIGTVAHSGRAREVVDGVVEVIKPLRALVLKLQAPMPQAMITFNVGKAVVVCEELTRQRRSQLSVLITKSIKAIAEFGQTLAACVSTNSAMLLELDSVGWCDRRT